MDLTPETLRSATFRDKLRGYHPDDVDEFLESVARGLEVLLARLRDASERARSAVVAEPPPNTDEAVRTLSLAQRTADLAIHEAKAEAERLLKAAEQKARKVVGDAEESGLLLAEAAQAELRSDLEKLQGARDQLVGEVNSLGSWLQSERTRIRRALIEVADRLENVREKSEVPSVRPTNAPSPPRQKQDAVRARAATPAPVVEPARGDPHPAPPPAAPAPHVARATPPGGQPPIARPTSSSVPAPPRSPEPPRPAPKVNERSDEGVLARAQFGIQQQRADADPLDDDPYFAELRAAMYDNTPLGPRDDDGQPDDKEPNPPSGHKTA